MKILFFTFLSFTLLNANADANPAPLCFSDDEQMLIKKRDDSLLTPDSLAFAIKQENIRLRMKTAIPVIKSNWGEDYDYRVNVRRSSINGYYLSHGNSVTFNEFEDPCYFKVKGLTHPKETLGTSTKWDLKTGEIRRWPKKGGKEDYFRVILNFETTKNNTTYQLELNCVKTITEGNPYFCLQDNEIPFELIGADSPYNTVNQQNGQKSPARKKAPPPVRYAEKPVEGENT